MEGQEASILIGILGAETPDVVSGVPELDATIKRGSIPLSSTTHTLYMAFNL